MEESKLNEILLDFKKDNLSFKAKVISIKSEVRGSTMFTDQVWSPSHVPVNKLFERNPKQSYRFIEKDEILLMSSIGCDTGRTIYYACEIINGLPNNNWWYFKYDHPFEECETLIEVS